MLTKLRQAFDLTVPEFPLVAGATVGAVVAVSVDIGELNPLMANGLGDRLGA